MGLCELCGGGEAIFRATIEGSDLKVCNKCSKFGKIKKKPVLAVGSKSKSTILKKRSQQDQQHSEELVSGYGSIIKKARERLGLKQKGLAKMLSEKESLINNIEREHLKPSINIIKKIEKTLNIVLIESVEEEKKERSSIDSENLTIGDIIKIKSKKKH